jgi:methylase of polypeptide subunit release factors
MGNTRECYMISGRGLVMQRELGLELDEKARCSPPEGAVPDDRVTLFGRVFAELPSADSATLAAIKVDLALLAEELRAAEYTRESILLIGQRPYINPSFVDLYTLGRPTGAGKLHDLVRFFTVALPLERSALEATLSPSVVQRLISLRAVRELGKDLVESMVHIFPVEGNYYFADVNNHEDNAIYKFGPDSLGLTAPVADVVSTVYRPGSSVRVLDLCTGSGIQGINAALHARAAGLTVDLNLVDINPRSKRFVTANLLMNGLDDVATWHEGDLFTALPDDVTSPHFDVILANPPYWPAHNKLLFHAGGLDGEAVTKKVVSDGTPLLKENGLMFIVTPIFNTDKAGPGSAPVLERIRSWGWPASMQSVVLYGRTLEDQGFYDLFNAKKPPITREMLDDVGIINAAEG